MRDRPLDKAQGIEKQISIEMQPKKSSANLNMKKHKRPARCVGDLVKIPLDDKWHVYARVLGRPLFAFYDSRTKAELPFNEIKKRPILFKIWVMDRAIASGRWKVVGSYALEDSLTEIPEFFKQDPINRQNFSIYRKGQERTAAPEECAGLERAAVWDPEHVEDRLRDHYAGKPNKWVESMKIRS
jgi:hypothetical protein